MNKAALHFHFRRKPRLPILLQEESSECGQACVAMVAQYFGHEVDLHYLRKISQSSSLGSSLLGIKNICSQLGFVTRALQVPLEELALVKTPAILHWNMNHFVVLKEVRGRQITIHDPAMGLRVCSLEEASASFTGIVLEIEKHNDFSAIREKKKLSLYDLIKPIQGVPLLLTLMMVLSVSIELLSLLNPLFMQYVTDDVIATVNANNLSLIATAFVILLGLQSFIELVRGNLTVYISSHLTEQFSSHVVNHLLKLPLAFFERRHKGDIQSKFQSIEQIQRKISVDFINTVLDGCFVLIHLAVMFLYSLKLTLLVIASTGMYLGLRYASYHVLKKEAQTSLAQHAKAATLFLETLQTMMPIKSFLKEDIRLNSWRNAFVRALNADIVLAKIQVIYKVLNQVLFHGEHLLVVCLGASEVLQNQWSLGMMMAFLSYRLLLVNKASSLIQNVFDYKLLSVQLNRLADIVFQEPEPLCSGDRIRAVKPHGRLSCKNISFQYSNQDPYILNQLNIEVEAGEKVAIVGASGSGKTTLLKIMMGLLPPSEGEILIDGQPLQIFGLKNYRKQSAAVMQDDALFSGSIMDNIAFFDEEVNSERVYQSAALACIHDSIMAYPMQYETLVGDMGSTLSGGQKQRILLARALYKEPKFLFLDEASSHLDVANERQINQALKALNISQVIIAHREESIRMADRVIDLKDIQNKV